MKRTLSLLLALIMVVTMIPAVFAAEDKDKIDFGEILDCPHENVKYTDNGDDTHTGKCECGEVVADNEAHADTDSNGACDSCGAELVHTDPNLKFYRNNDSGGDLMLQDDIRTSFMIDVRKLNYDEIYLEITMNGVTTTVYKDEGISNASVYRFPYTVRAPYMTIGFTVAIFGVKDGVTYSGEVMDFSVRKCVDAKMKDWHPKAAGNTSITNQCRLLMSLLDYGAKTQLQFTTLETGELATNNLPSEYDQYFPTGTPALADWPADETNKQVTFRTLGLMLQEKVKVSAIFQSTKTIGSATAVADDITVVVKHNRSRENDVITYTYTSKDTDYIVPLNATNFRFFFDKLSPNRLRDQLEITVYKGDVAISTTFVRSVDMILNQSNYLTPGTLNNLAFATLRYGDCAKAVFG